VAVRRELRSANAGLARVRREVALGPASEVEQVEIVVRVGPRLKSARLPSWLTSISQLMPRVRATSRHSFVHTSTRNVSSEAGSRRFDVMKSFAPSAVQGPSRLFSAPPGVNRRRSEPSGLIV
jgi:hypothetical protein